MRLSSLDDILWAAGFLAYIGLFSVLLIQQRWKEFPVFTTLVGFDTALTVALFLFYAHGSRLIYARLYWSAAIVDFALQLALVSEIARILLRPTGTWVRDARNQFLLWGGAGIACAALLAWAVSPPGLSSKEVWQVRGSLFTSLVICELVLVMALSATRLGLGWRSHVMALGQGLGVWAIVAVAVDSAQSFLGAKQSFATLDHVRIGVYCAVLGYWIVQFWRPEPVRREISPEMREYIVALHRRVAYDVESLNVRG